MAAFKPQFILSFDFDGTMVHPESDPIFHPGLGQMIQQLRRQGAVWVINTGRSLGQTLQGLSEYGFLMEPDYIIAEECKIYYPGRTGADMWRDFGDWNHDARAAHEKFVKDHKAEFNAIREMLAGRTKAELLEGGFGELGIISHTEEEMEDIAAFIDKLSVRKPDLGYHRNGIYLRFCHSGYSKGTALAELTRQLDLTASRCFAAGDNYNDLSMLNPSHAAMIACPGNALTPIKAHVEEHRGFVAQRVASEGMMEALSHFFGSKK